MPYEEWRREVADMLGAMRASDHYQDTLRIYHSARCTPRETVAWLLREYAEAVPLKLDGKFDFGGR